MLADKMVSNGMMYAETRRGVEGEMMGSENVTVTTVELIGMEVDPSRGEVEATTGGVRSAVVKEEVKVEARGLEEGSVAEAERVRVYVVGTMLSNSPSGVRTRVVGGVDHVGEKDGVDGVMDRAAREVVGSIGSEKVIVMFWRKGDTSVASAAGKTDVMEGGVRSAVVNDETKVEERGLEEGSVAEAERVRVYVVGTMLSNSPSGVRTRVVGGVDQVGVKNGVDGVMERADKVEAISIGSEKTTVMLERNGEISVEAAEGAMDAMLGGVRSDVTKEESNPEERGLEDGSVADDAIEME